VFLHFVILSFHAIHGVICWNSLTGIFALQTLQ
jgi:hypothetical protein